MSPAATNPLADRLAELEIDAAELAAMIGRPVEDVEAWVAGDGEPDADARVLLRVLSDDHRAALAVQRVRDGWTANLQGDAATLAGIATPGDGAGYQGATGGRPQ